MTYQPDAFALVGAWAISPNVKDRLWADFKMPFRIRVPARPLS
jgi:hypothetical protein